MSLKAKKVLSLLASVMCMLQLYVVCLLYTSGRFLTLSAGTPAGTHRETGTFSPSLRTKP